MHIYFVKLLLFSLLDKKEISNMSQLFRIRYFKLRDLVFFSISMCNYLFVLTVNIEDLSK